ncbi:unnamed protein product [Sphagnum jensenii]|uniref:Uncharacterized protein n=1 Tax=Sphagnum jensenii TaxID=128206 RepID=A0ABP1AZH9_9BRYO
MGSPISVENGTSLRISRQQCMPLSKKRLETQEILETVEHKRSDEATITHETVVKDCVGNGNWIESALRQGGDVKEAFGEILCDLQWYTILMRTFFKLPFPDRSTPPSWHLKPADCDRKLIEADDNKLLTAARQDQDELKLLTGEGRPSLDDIVTVAESNRMAKSSSSQVLLEEQGTSGSQGVVPAKTMGEGMSTRDDNVVMDPRTVTSSSSHLLVQEQGTSTSQGGGMSTPNDNVVTEPSNKMETSSNQALKEEEGTSSCLWCCWR